MKGRRKDIDTESREKKKSRKREQFWNALKDYVIVVFACVLLLFVKPHVIALLDRAVAWLDSCSREWFAVLFTSTCIVLSVRTVIKIQKKEPQVAHSTIAAVLFVALVYFYFRVLDDTYVFWGIGGYKWCDALFVPAFLLLVQKIVCGQHKNKDSDALCQHIIDKPIDDPQEDLFGYDWMSQSLLDDLTTIDLGRESFSVGILGEWGQGKSSFLNLFKRHADSQDSIVVEFYPRASKSIKRIQEDFFIAFKRELRRYHTGIDRYISNYARDVADVDEGWIGKLALVFSHLSTDREKNRINDVIRSIGRRVYVIIEDLDRLTGEEILEVLKLIERNGDFNNTVFVAAYDKKYVNAVIGKHLKTQRKDFTDKYFDYEYPLPLNRHEVLASFAGEFLSRRVALEPKDKIDVGQLNAAWEENKGVIVESLGTMRHIKRYLNIFMSRYPKVKNDVDASDFMLLTLLRYKDMAAYNAISRLDILKIGSHFISGTPKLIYLQDDYMDRLKRLHIADSSKEIIERLFYKAEANGSVQIDEVYSKLKWADSFECYFSDYRIGKYHFEDFQRLLSEEEDKVASSVSEILADGFSVQLTDFIRSRKESWVVDEKGLTRMIKILFHMDNHNRTTEVDYMISGMLYAFAMREYVKSKVVRDEDHYRLVVEEAFASMLTQYPMEVGFACIRTIDNQTNTRVPEQLAFSLERLVDLALKAQNQYYNKYDKGGYQIGAILNLAKIHEHKKNSIRVVEPAKRELIAWMQHHPEQFARDIVEASPFVDTNGMRFLTLRFNAFFEYEKLLDLSGFSFLEWASALPDIKMSYVTKRIYETGRGNNLQVPSLREEYGDGDFEGYYAAVKAFDDSEDEGKVLAIIKNQISLDYNTLCDLSGLDVTRAQAAIKRLMQNKRIDESYGLMKMKMEAIEKGDYVRVRDDKYELYAKTLYYSDNVFKVADILEDGTFKLVDIGVPVMAEDIEAIPVDGRYDRKLYYDPAVAASYVALGQPVPSHHENKEEYYMDEFATTEYNGKKIKAIIEEGNCRFVHEVQHCLRRMFKRDDLKLNKSIIYVGSR